METLRTCASCGSDFGPRDNREGRDFLERQYCSQACARDGRTNAAVADFFARASVSDTGCWEWTRALTGAGYGSFRNRRFSTDLAHRVSYILTHGKIPEGKQIDHVCRNRRCINPEHLEAVDPGENTRRGLSSYAIRTTCRFGGHDISDPDSWVSASDRTCAACVRKQQVRRRDAQKSLGPTPCPQCDRSFNGRRGLASHLKQVHDFRPGQWPTDGAL